LPILRFYQVATLLKHFYGSRTSLVGLYEPIKFLNVLVDCRSALCVNKRNFSEAQATKHDQCGSLSGK
jgi:hypothetical protein